MSTSSKDKIPILEIATSNLDRIDYFKIKSISNKKPKLNDWKYVIHLIIKDEYHNLICASPQPNNIIANKIFNSAFDRSEKDLISWSLDTCLNKKKRVK